MPDGSGSTSRRGEKTACVGTWVRPEVKRDVKAAAERQGVTIAEYLRQLVHETTRRGEKAAAA